MDFVKHCFDILDYVALRLFLLALMVVGAVSLIKIAHGRRADRYLPEAAEKQGERGSRSRIP